MQQASSPPAHIWYPDEPLFKEIPIQVKYNRARIGNLKAGSRVRNVKLVNLDGEEEHLLPHVGGGLFGRLSSSRKRSKNGISVVVAGSFS